MTLGHNRPPMPAGWIAVHRTIRTHPVVGYGKPVKPCDPSLNAYSRSEAWQDLLMECRYQDGTVINGGRQMELRRGEVVGAVSYLAARWNWTPKTVRHFLDLLEQNGMISLRKPGVERGMQKGMHQGKQEGEQRGLQKGKQATVISVCNYEKYQSAPFEEGQANRQAEGQAEGTERGEQKGNNLTKDNNNNKTIWGKRERTPEEIAEADRLAVEALEAGQRIKGGSVAKSARAVVVTTGELDGSRGITFRDGKLTVVNGAAAQFAEEFPGVDLTAVCNRAAPEISRKGHPDFAYACSVIRKWAQIQLENNQKEAAPRSSRKTVDVASALAARFRNGGA